jgi:hypothetical protein
VRESGAEKEVSLKLAAMQAEREKQDTMWNTLQTKTACISEMEKHIQPSTEQGLSKRR